MVQARTVKVYLNRIECESDIGVRCVVSKFNLVVFFQIEEIFVQLDDELDRITHA